MFIAMKKASQSDAEEAPFETKIFKELATEEKNIPHHAINGMARKPTKAELSSFVPQQVSR